MIELGDHLATFPKSPLGKLLVILLDFLCHHRVARKPFAQEDTLTEETMMQSPIYNSRSEAPSTLPLALCLSFAAMIAWPGSVTAADSPKPATYTMLDILELTLDRNPYVAIAQGSIDQTYGDRITAGAYPNPTISGNTGQGSSREFGRFTPGAIAESPPGSVFEYMGTIGQPLEWPAKRQARKSAAEAGLAGATVGLVETRLNLIADVNVAFYELLLTQRDLELARQNLDIVKDVRGIVGTRVRLGEAPEFDLIKADVEVMKAEQVVTRSENNVLVARVMLDTLTLGALGDSFRITGDFRTFPDRLPFDQLVTRAMDQHPTVQRLGKAIEQADRTVEFQRQARVPNVTVSGSYIREFGREAALAGVSIPTPIWYQRQGEIASSLGSKRREEAELLRVRNELHRQINQYVKDAQATARLITVFEKGLLRQAEEALRIAKVSFRQGAASLLEVLDAQRVQRQILFDYAQARFELSVALAKLERAVGGPLSAL